jgi:site-specific DNA recombinase
MRTAAYARYSSDSQREASLEDQLRNVRAFCARQGWPAPEEFTDQAISGARIDRPGYQRLLAQASQFDVILVDDLSRLSRDSIESATAVKRLRFAGVRLIGVSDGIDTARKDAKVGAGLRGLMSELYLDDLAEKTHRGLSGRALDGASAGGLPFGYRVTKIGERAIDANQAEVVRRIFADYLSGLSPRQIAHALNAEGIPTARGKTWAMSAIHGDTKRGIGILANPIYGGRQIWNRSRFVKHPDTGRRVRKERPRSEWITTEHPDLAIIDAETFERVQRRLTGQSRTIVGGGRPPRHLLSGLLRCGDCGAPIVAVDAYRYGCSAAKDRGTCSSTLKVARKPADEAMLAGVRDQLLSPELFAVFQREAAAELRRRGGAREEATKRLDQAKRWRENVLQAIREGFRSESVKADLEAAEAAVAAAEREIAAPALARILPDARARFERLRASLRENAKARETLRALIGEAILRKENGEPVAELAAVSLALVAGAGFGRWNAPPTLIRLNAGAGL